nr:cell adhesion molecule 1-like [Lytechinus pictus]
MYFSILYEKCTCTVTGGSLSPNTIQWIDATGGGFAVPFNGELRFSQDPKYSNFNVTSLSGTESVMTIHSADVGDGGDYACVIPSDTSGSSVVTIDVQAPGNATTTISSSVDENGEDMYEATCDVVGSKPQVDIIWILNGVTQTDGNGNTIVQTHPTATPPLSNTRSVFTFQATQENYGWTFICQATGFELPDIDLQKSRVLDIHSSPSDATTTVTADYVTYGTDNIRVTCNAENEPLPTMRNYYIFSNGTLIHETMDSVKEVSVSNPNIGTEYTCMAGNYLGNTSLSAPVTYDPTRTTTPPPTTGM